MLLLDDLLLLLQRQDERLLLKSHSRTLTPTPDGKTMLRPVLRLTSAITREVATGEAPAHGVGGDRPGGLGSMWGGGCQGAPAEAKKAAKGPGALWVLRREPGSSPGFAGSSPLSSVLGNALWLSPGDHRGTGWERQSWGFAEVHQQLQGSVGQARLGTCCLMDKGCEMEALGQGL